MSTARRSSLGGGGPCRVCGQLPRGALDQHQPGPLACGRLSVRLAVPRHREERAAQRLVGLAVAFVGRWPYSVAVVAPITAAPVAVAAPNSSAMVASVSLGFPLGVVPHDGGELVR